MTHRLLASLVLAVCFATGQSRTVQRVEPALRASSLVPGAEASESPADASWKASVETSLSNLLSRAPSQESGDEKKAETEQPVQSQVPEKEMSDFLEKLTPGCRKRFTATLNGEDAPLHTFGEHGANTSHANCEKLNGSLCFTEAHVAQMKETGGGRQMKSTVDVEGNGCLPRECMAKDDLKSLAEFMSLRAKDTIPGMGVTVKLHVDCSISGGTMVDVGGSETQKAAPEPRRSSAVALTLPALAFAVVVDLLRP